MNARICLVLCFCSVMFCYSPVAQELNELEEELLRLEEKMTEKDSLRKLQANRQKIIQEIASRVGQLNGEFLDAFRASEFEKIDVFLEEGIEILSGEYVPDCHYSADFFVNFSDYLIIKGKEKQFYDLLGLIPEECDLKIEEYLELVYFNSIGKYDEAAIAYERMEIKAIPECFKEGATYDEQIDCYKSLNLYSTIYVGTLLNISIVLNQKGDTKGAFDYAQAAINMAVMSDDEEMKFTTSLAKASLHFSKNHLDKVYALLTPFESTVGKMPSVYQKEYYRLMQAIAMAKGDEGEAARASNKMNLQNAEIKELQTVEEQIDAAFRFYDTQRIMDIQNNGMFSDSESSLGRIVRELEEKGQTNSFNYVKGLIMLAASKGGEWNFTFDEPKDILESKLPKITDDRFRLPIIKELAQLTFDELDDQAFVHLAEMRSIAEQMNQKVIRFEATIRLAYLNDMYDMNKEALEFYQQSIREALILIEDYYPFLTEREQFYFNSKWIRPLERSAFTFYLKVPEMSKSMTEDLLNFRIRTKSLILENSARLRILVENSNNEESSAIYEQLRQLKEKLSMKQDEMDWAEKSEKIKEIESLEERIQVRMGVGLKNDVDSNLEGIRKSLGSSEGAIEIVRFQKATGEFLTDSVAYLAFVVSKNQPIKMISFPSPHLMENAGFDFYLRTIKFKVEDKRSFSEFWEPINPETKDFKTLYVSSDGVFNGINLGAIKNPKTNKYLFEDRSIIQISSLRDLTKKRTKRQIKLNESVFIGRPKYFLSEESSSSESRGANIADLPGTEKEILAISAKLEEKQVSFENHLGEQANENVVKNLNSPSVLHIATHGFFNKKAVENDEFNSPLLSSGLLMSGAGEGLDSEGQDGILSAYEITGVNLTGTDLVVLSACESGIGESRDGQGVYGLSRAFFIAGAETVIASLWKVDDAATQKFMDYFYEYWLESYSVSEAMDFARDKLKKEYPQPYYWAAFVATGF